MPGRRPSLSSSYRVMNERRLHLMSSLTPDVTRYHIVLWNAALCTTAIYGRCHNGVIRVDFGMSAARLLPEVPGVDGPANLTTRVSPWAF
jgi:hypothetical protein